MRGGHILGKCPDENLITTVGYLAYMDDKSIILGRGIENHCDEDGTRRVKDTIYIPMSLVASFGSFDWWTMTNEEYNKWIILYFDMQSINLQFNCNDIASSLKAQRDKIKQFCIDCLTGVKYQADSFLFDTNACIFSTPETRELLFSHEEYLILEVDTTKAVDGKYP